MSHSACTSIFILLFFIVTMMNVLVYASSEEENDNDNDKGSGGYELNTKEENNVESEFKSGGKIYKRKRKSDDDEKEYQSANRNKQKIDTKIKAKDKLNALPKSMQYVIVTYLNMSDELNYLSVNKYMYNLLYNLYCEEYILFVRQYFCWIKNKIGTPLYYSISNNHPEFTKYTYEMAPEKRRALYQTIFSRKLPTGTNARIENFFNQNTEQEHQIIFKRAKNYNPDNNIHPQFYYDGANPIYIDLNTHILYDGWRNKWLAQNNKHKYKFWSALPLVFTTHENPNVIIHISSYDIEAISNIDNKFSFKFTFYKEDAFYSYIYMDLNWIDYDTHYEIKTTVWCYPTEYDELNDLDDDNWPINHMRCFFQKQLPDEEGICNLCKYKNYGS